MDENKNSREQNYVDPFNRLMFGENGQTEERNQHEADHSSNSSLDLDELMANIDTLIESAKNLKPVFQKALPKIERLWQKWKEDD